MSAMDGLHIWDWIEITEKRNSVKNKRRFRELLKGIRRLDLVSSVDERSGTPDSVTISVVGVVQNIESGSLKDYRSHIRHLKRAGEKK